MKSIFIHFKKSGSLLPGLILLLLLFQSCKDDADDAQNEPSYTITGYLYKDCSMQPIANLNIDLFQEIQVNLDNSVYGGVLASTATDNNGYFKFEFKDKKGGFQSIRYAAGAGYNHIIDNIPSRKSINNLVLFKTVSTNIQVKLNVINPHQTGDTLHITNFNSSTDYLVACPLSSGVLYTGMNYSLPVMYYGGEQSRIIWWLNNYNGSYEQQDFLFDKFCSDTIFVTATIN